MRFGQVAQLRIAPPCDERGPLPRAPWSFTSSSSAGVALAPTHRVYGVWGGPAALRLVVEVYCLAMATSMRGWMLALLGLLSSAAVLHSVEAQQTTLLFAFGDSYADVGNLPKSGPNQGYSWKTPYGITWPEKNGPPAGRFSDGKTQTDWITDLLKLPVYPPPYLYSSGADTSSGVNFAVGGSGITPANNPVSLGSQVDNFELFLRTNPYSKSELANSLTLVSVVGNDYLRFTGTTSAELFVYIERIVSGIQANLQRLYDLGLRNVMVPNLFNTDCAPLFTRANGYTKCADSTSSSALIHNAFLLGAVQSINAQNPGARFIILDQYKAFDKLIADGGFRDGLKPCCEGTSNSTSCGDTDPNTQKWLFTVCKSRGRAIFWDDVHPTMWAWNYIVNLYAYHAGYITLADAPTLQQWLQVNDVVEEPVGAPMSPPDPSTAIGEVQAALDFFLTKPQYSEALGLLQSLNLDSVLANYPSAVVTVFVPTNDALADPDSRPFIDRVFAQNLVNDVGLYHVADGYFDLNAIVGSKPSSVNSVSGSQIPLSYPADGVYVGPNAQAKVIEPNVYNVPGQVVFHGINHLIQPPGV